MAVSLHPALEDYLLAILQATRESPDLALGASPRAGQALARASRAHAFVRGRDFVVPDDVQAMVEPVLGHRLVAAYSQESSAGSGSPIASILEELMASVPAPR